MNTITTARQFWGPTEFCALDDELCNAIAIGKRQSLVLLSAIASICVCACIYGFVFGFWRAPLQGLYSALKMPILLISVVLSSALINTVLAQVQGARLSFVQVSQLMMFGMAVTSAILASVSPIIAFWLLQIPSPPANETLESASQFVMAYQIILVCHVGLVAAAGVVGQVKVYRLLRPLLATRALAIRVLASWLGVIAFVGCELSWLLSPFLCSPAHHPHLVAQLYFEYNFYEYVWSSLMRSI